MTGGGDRLPVQVRLATRGDLGAINAIYNRYVPVSTCTYQETLESDEERLLWFEQHTSEHPVTVAVHDGCVVGWGALSAFRNRSAYRFSVETSVYVHAEWHGRGIGTALLLDLVERGRALGHHAILALIDSGQTASLSLHAKCGFVEVGRLPQIGFKFDHWLDVVIMECMLGGR